MNQPNPDNFVNSYSDTRGQVTSAMPFSQAIIEGLADGGGLFVPKILPKLNLDEITQLAQQPYALRAAYIYRRFGVDFTPEHIESMMHAAYSNNFTDAEITPITKVGDNSYLLELVHGPTAAFKDLALQCLPHFFSAALEKHFGSETTAASLDNPTIPLHLILVATSGDTGSAALAGFSNRDHTAVIVYYPKDGVSDIQMRQMACAEGDNVKVVAVKGNFDDCQTAVKQVFNDPNFAAELAKDNVKLSSANSINWGRLLPQIVYYVSAYAQMVATQAIQPGQPIDVCVPTGNFGNILAAWYAREIGTPIGRLYCASNENRVLTDFINTGTYDIADRQFTTTPSPSMDILVSSNLERQLFELNGRDPELITQWMTALSTERKFSVDKTTFEALRRDFSADWVSNDESLDTIREVYETHGYLLDPHTAVAWKVAERLRSSDEVPVLIVATAHWAKFPDDVYRALNSLPAGTELPVEIADLSGSELIAQLQQSYAISDAPELLASLDNKPIRFTESCEGTPEALMLSITSWLNA